MLKSLRKGVSLITAISVTSVNVLTYNSQKAIAQEYSGCFMIGESGQYIDLSHVCGEKKVQDFSLKERFFRSIKKLGVSIVNEDCEPNILGSYQPGLNKMTLCKNTIKTNDMYIETLAHESWHLVQDCAGDLDDSEMKPVTVDNPQWFKSILNNLNHADLQNLSLYDSEDLPYEVEAFAMEKHPELVLKGLDACASKYLAQK